MTESSLNSADTSTLPFVAAVTSAEAVGFTGAILSMLLTVYVATSEKFPAASVPRKLTEPFSVNLTDPVYVFQVWPSREYSLTTESALNVAETSTSPFVAVVTSAEAIGFAGGTLSMLLTV